jgi:hypothetical protein
MIDAKRILIVNYSLAILIISTMALYPKVENEELKN